MSVTTKTGDDGYTSLLKGKRVHKFDLRVELMGTIDEFSSQLGIVKSELQDMELKEDINSIQKFLHVIMAQIAYGNSEKYNITNAEITSLEDKIYNYESLYISDNKFTIPGNNKQASLIDLGRAVCRKVERQLLSVDRFYSVHQNCKTYINRVSDYLYTAARYIDFKEEIKIKVKEMLMKEELIHKDINKITLKLAKAIIEEVEVKAEKSGVPVVIAIANEWGQTIAVHFMDGALPASYSIAVDKAYTSAAVRLTTEKVGELSQNGQPLYGIGNTNNNRIITFGGGYPLSVKDKVLGGIGVSGGTAEQDIELAAYGAGILSKYTLL